MTKSKYQVFLLVFMTFIASQCLSAQEKFRVSLSGGGNHNDITYSASNRVNTAYSGKNGYYLKAGINFKPYKNISFQSGLTYIQKNYVFQRTGPREGVSTIHKANYFNMPFMIGLQPLFHSLENTKFNFEIFAGTYIGWWNSLERESNIQVLGEADIHDNIPIKKVADSYDFNKNENHFNRLDYGLQAETRISYFFQKNINLFIEYSFMYGLSDNQKNQLRKTSNYYYTTSNYGIGIAYNL